MGQKKLDLISGEVLIEVARASDDIPGIVHGVLQQELPKVWQGGFEAGQASRSNGTVRRPE